MGLDGTLADPEVRGDIFARLAREDQFHDLALPGREARKTTAGIPLPGEQHPQILVPADQLFDATKQHQFSGKSLTQPVFCQHALNSRFGPAVGHEAWPAAVTADLQMFHGHPLYEFHRFEILTKVMAEAAKSH
jgi:hypothetical protein